MSNQDAERKNIGRGPTLSDEIGGLAKSEFIEKSAELGSIDRRIKTVKSDIPLNGFLQSFLKRHQKLSYLKQSGLLPLFPRKS